jgi:hypothetical protein
MVEIDKDIPVPVRPRIDRGDRYPWQEMEVGNSFFVPKSPRINLFHVHKRYGSKAFYQSTRKRRLPRVAG